MTATLYRKYRPQTFADVVGQEHVTTTLINQIKHGKSAHAYLFAGPRGVGKTTTARLLAKALQAADPKTGEPDESDSVVAAMSAGRSLDLVEIDAASNRRIEEIRELREHVKYPPNQAKYKVFIIDEVHMLTTEAFNALLKTLEEPPQHVVFILATTELHKLPETIISRCQRFDFKPVSHDVLVERLAKLAHLENSTVDSDVLDAVVRLSGGCVRDAEGFLGQLLSLGKKNITLDDARLVMPITITTEVADLVLGVYTENIVKTMARIQSMYEQGNDIRMILEDMLAIGRVQLLWKVGVDDADILGLNTSQKTALYECTATIPIEKIQKALQILFEHLTYVDNAPLQILPLEMACVELQHLFHPIDEIPEVSQHLQKKDTSQKQIHSDFSAKSVKNNTQVVSDAKQPIHDAEIWNPILEELKQENPALAQYLVTATVSFVQNKLVVGVSHPFHFEIAQKAQNLTLLSTVANKVAGQDVHISIILDSQPSTLPANMVDSSFVDQIATDFGGQVVV